MTPLCTGAVDEAFAAVSSGLTAYWTEIDGGNLNGTAKQVYFNINNHSPYSVLLTGGSQFQIRFDLINSDRTGLNQDRLNLTQSTTSWGCMSPVVGGTTDNGNGTSVNSATTTWTTAANGTTSIPAQGNNNDNTADMTISAPGNSIIKATYKRLWALRSRLN